MEKLHAYALKHRIIKLTSFLYFEMGMLKVAVRISEGSMQRSTRSP